MSNIRAKIPAKSANLAIFADQRGPPCAVEFIGTPHACEPTPVVVGLAIS
jgi:hypothetical protein